MSSSNNLIVIFREPENSRVKQWVNQSVRNNQFLLWVFKTYFNSFKTIQKVIEITSLKLNILVVCFILILVGGISWNLSSLNFKRIINNDNAGISEANVIASQIFAINEASNNTAKQINDINSELPTYLGSLDKVSELGVRIDSISAEVKSQSKLQQDLLNPEIAKLNFNYDLDSKFNDKIKGLQSGFLAELELQENSVSLVNCIQTASKNILQAESQIASQYQTFANSLNNSNNSNTTKPEQIKTFFNSLSEQVKASNDSYQQLKACDLLDSNYQNKLALQIQIGFDIQVNTVAINQFIDSSDKDKYTNTLKTLQNNLSNYSLKNASKEIQQLVNAENNKLQINHSEIEKQIQFLEYLKF